MRLFKPAGVTLNETSACYKCRQYFPDLRILVDESASNCYRLAFFISFSPITRGDGRAAIS